MLHIKLLKIDQLKNDQNVNKAALPDNSHMSTEPRRKRTRSTKSNTAELEAKIAELEARLANLSSQVQPGVARPAEREAPKPQARASPPPPTLGETRGKLPAGMKPAPKPAPAPEPRETYSPEPGEVAPAYATISSTEYTGNRYYATRRRLAYHPPDKQFTGTSYVTTTSAPPPPTPEPYYEPEPAAQVSKQRGTMPAGTKPEEKKSMWRSKGAEYENYVSAEEKKTPPPPPREEPKPAPRPTASGPTHGTLPAGMKLAPKPAPAPKPDVIEAKMSEAVGEVAPAYATISSTEYTGNKYYATRKRMSYHPPDKQFTGSATTATAAPPAPEPPNLHIRRGTLPAGFKPS